MPLRRLCIALFAALSLIGANRWARYEHEMQHPVDNPPGAWDKTELPLPGSATAPTAEDGVVPAGASMPIRATGFSCRAFAG